MELVKVYLAKIGEFYRIPHEFQRAFIEWEDRKMPVCARVKEVTREIRELPAYARGQLNPINYIYNQTFTQVKIQMQFNNQYEFDQFYREYNSQQPMNFHTDEFIYLNCQITQINVIADDFDQLTLELTATCKRIVLNFINEGVVRHGVNTVLY